MKERAGLGDRSGGRGATCATSRAERSARSASTLRSALRWLVFLAMAVSACGGSARVDAKDDRASAAGSASGAGAGGGGSVGTGNGVDPVARAGGENGEGSADCVWNEQHHAVGESFPCNCSTCTCRAGGAIESTFEPCPPCSYLGKLRKYQQEFPDRDGCNTCHCEPTGVVCTHAECACDPGREWWRQYLEHDPEACQRLDHACPEHASAFQNECGCGCEEGLGCDRTLSCVEPGSSKDCRAERAWCPFARIPD